LPVCNLSLFRFISRFMFTCWFSPLDSKIHDPWIPLFLAVSNS
jgi:hypothetical protein